MGFYGKVTNVNNTSFSFDKVYPNKFTMMNKCAEDGVFVGRFVLVEYDNDPVVYCKRLYKKGIEECLYFDSNLSEQTKAIFVEKNTLVSGPYDVYHGELVYIVQYTTQGEPYYVFYVCTGKATDDKQTAIFQPLGAGNNYSNDKYTYNYSIDTGAYGLSKGFDSTVWQKIYQNGNYKYVQVAELNSVIPTFSLLIDPPTQNPIAPYFDKNQTSVYYPLHVQPTWGFWVKEAAKGTASDQRVQHYISQYDANAQAVITKNNWVNGDIFFNKDGFNKDLSVITEEGENKINITPGKSGITYRDFKDSSRTYTSNDVYELSLRIPDLGNSVAKVYDVLGGVNEDHTRRWDDPDNIELTNVTGALNSIKYKFNSLNNNKKNKLLFVGENECEHGQGVLGYQIQEADLGIDKWLTFSINPENEISSEDGSKLTGDIIIKHNYPWEYSDTALDPINMNDLDKNSINIINFESDETGHIKSKSSCDITLPYSFKFVKTTGLNNGVIDLATEEGTVTADNTKDTLNINPSNKWIKIKATDEGNIIQLAHEVHNFTSTTSNDNKNGAEDEVRSIDLLSYSFDEAGHYVSSDIKTIHLPLAYGKLSGDTGSTDASTNHDEISLVGDLWIGSTAEKDKIVFNHKKAQTAITIKGESANKTLAFGDQFKVIQTSIDANGHVNTLNEYIMTLPKGKYEENENGSAKVITSLSFTDTTGTLTGTYKNIGLLNLTGYEEGNVNTDIIATDSINTAFGKLQHQIHSMDYADTTNENQIIDAINQTDGVITPVRTNITSKKLGGYSLGNSTASISDGDTLGIALGKIQSNLNIINGQNAGSIKKALEEAKEYTNTSIANIINADNNGKIDKLNEVFTWIGNNKDASSIISDIQVNKEAIDKLVGTGDGSVSNDINNAIIEVKGVGYTKGTLKSHEDSITELYNKIAALEEKINTQETT